MGRTVFLPCYLTWGQTTVEVMKIMATSFERSQAHPAALSAPTPAAGQRRPTPPPEMPGHSQANPGQSLMGHCSLLLGPDVHLVLFVPPRVVSPVLCNFWRLYGGVKGNLFQEVMPYPGLLHPEPLSLQQSTADRTLLWITTNCGKFLKR